jgi:antibiotic biosynthesis monooxygenase (ABM) superfamily enzyme
MTVVTARTPEEPEAHTGGAVRPSPSLTGPFDTAELPRISREPVTVTVERTIVPGREAEFEAWAVDVQSSLASFEGFLGAGVLRPGPGGGQYQIVFRFTDPVSLRRWERSPERAEHLARLDPLVLDTRVQRTVGVDEWFDAPTHAVPARRRWHTILVEVAWVYPVAVVVSLFLSPHLTAIPLLPRIALTTTFITTVMLVAVTPFRRWRRRRRTF